MTMKHEVVALVLLGVCWSGAAAGPPQPTPAEVEPSILSEPGVPGTMRADAMPPTSGTLPLSPPPPPAAGLSELRTFAFQGQGRKVLAGNSPEHGSGFDCGRPVDAGDQFGRLAILATFHRNACYTDGRYNARDFPVEKGIVVAGDGASFEAYRLSAPMKAAQQFLGSHHAVFYQFPEARDYTVYMLEQGAVSIQARVIASQIVVGELVKLPLDASAIRQPVTYFMAPSEQRVSGLTELAPQVEGALLSRGPLGSLSLYRYGQTGTPFDTRTGFTYGPGEWANMYAYPRRFFPMSLAAGALGVAWQDTTTMAVQVTSIDRSRLGQHGTSVDNPNRDILAAAASDGDQNVFLFFVQDGSGVAEDHKDRPRAARLVRVNLTTGAVAEMAADASASGLNITEFGTSNVASMAYAKGKLGLMIGRKKHYSTDGLNHQGGIAVVFDATTLKEIKNLGQTSGHSFENVLMSGADGSFVGIDLGDNFPRGIQLHRFAENTRKSAVIYTFKTAHGTSAKSPAGAAYPAYPQVSGETKYFKWSNDNATYTELGGIVEDASGYTVVFAGEAVAGRALDNARVGAFLNDPRNLGVIRVRRDFENFSSGGNEVADTLVLTKGTPETGGFFAFNGSWMPQRNTGVVWLTQYVDRTQANASRVRAVGLASGNILVLWECWTPNAYVTTYGMKINSMGEVLTPATDIGSAVRLGRRDDLWVDGNDVYIVTGRAAEHALDILVLREP